MKKYERRDNTPTIMVFCEDPITIDKSKEWGEGNKQDHPSGAWIQINANMKATHLVADGGGTPVGWTRGETQPKSRFIKKPVFATQCTDPHVKILTLDGEMTYDNPAKDGWVLFNESIHGAPDVFDAWFVTDEKFTELYIK